MRGDAHIPNWILLSLRKRRQILIIILLFILIKAFVFLIECAPAVTDHNPSAGIKVHMLTHRMNSGLLIFTRFTQYGQKPANHQIIDFLFIW